MGHFARLASAVAALAALAACGGERTADDATAVAARSAAGEPEGARERRPSGLIPRALLFGDPQRARGRLSPDGSTLAWLEASEGVLNVWIAPVDSLEDARPVTQARELGVYAFDWLRNNTHIVYSLGRGGAEPARVYAVDVITGEVLDLAPGGAETRSRLIATSWDYPDDVVVAANDRDPNVDDIYRVNVATGERELVYRNDERFSTFFFDRSLRLQAANRERADGGRELYALTPDGDWFPIGETPAEDAASTRFLGYDGTNTAIFALDSRGRDSAALTRLDTTTGEASVLAAVSGIDISDVLLHPTTFEADAVLINGLAVEWLPLTTRAANAFRVLDQRLRGDYFVLSRTVDDRLWIVFEISPTSPGAYHLFNRETEEIERLMDVRPDLTTYRLAPMTPVIVKTPDKLELVSYLTLPAGADADGDGRPETRSPLVIIPEVGPERRTTLGFDPTHQWLADRGYAALTVNVRGAEGFGKAFRTAGDGEIGGAVQDDLRAAAAWAVERGVADPERMAVFGARLGGQASLMAAAEPDGVFACAAAFDAPVDLVALAQTPPPEWAGYSAFLRRRLGDPSDPGTRATLRARSPATFAAHWRAPVFVVEGNPANSPSAQAWRTVAERALDAGADVGYVELPLDTGVFQAPRDSIAMHAAVEAFLATCLGGRVEPVEADLQAADAAAPLGAAHVPVLAAALEPGDDAGAP